MYSRELTVCLIKTWLKYLLGHICLLQGSSCDLSPPHFLPFFVGAGLMQYRILSRVPYIPQVALHSRQGSHAPHPLKWKGSQSRKQNLVKYWDRLKNKPGSRPYTWEKAGPLRNGAVRKTGLEGLKYYWPN